jgi:hypothetical protein
MPIYGVRHKNAQYRPVAMGEFPDAEAARADFDTYADSTDHEFIDITDEYEASVSEHGSYPPPGSPGYAASPEVTEAAEEAAEVAEEAAEAIAEHEEEIAEEIAEEVAEEIAETIVEQAEEIAEVAEVAAEEAATAETVDDGAAEAEAATEAEAAAEVVAEIAVETLPPADVPPKVKHWFYRERGKRASG